MAQAKMRLSAQEIADALGQAYGVRVTALRPYFRVDEKNGVVRLWVEAIDVHCEASPGLGFAGLVQQYSKEHESPENAAGDPHSTDAKSGSKGTIEFQAA